MILCTYANSGGHAYRAYVQAFWATGGILRGAIPCCYPVDMQANKVMMTKTPQEVNLEGFLVTLPNVVALLIRVIVELNSVRFFKLNELPEPIRVRAVLQS